MSSRSHRVPRYRHYKPKNLAVVCIDGKDEYLGRYGSDESWERHHRRIAEWHAGGRTPEVAEDEQDGLTVVEVLTCYLRFARQYYRKGGRPTSEVGETRRSFQAACPPSPSGYGP